jgi:hypothetical protein
MAGLLGAASCRPENSVFWLRSGEFGQDSPQGGAPSGPRLPDRNAHGLNIATAARETVVAKCAYCARSQCHIDPECHIDNVALTIAHCSGKADNDPRRTMTQDGR